MSAPHCKHSLHGTKNPTKGLGFGPTVLNDRGAQQQTGQTLRGAEAWKTEAAEGSLGSFELPRCPGPGFASFDVAPRLSWLLSIRVSMLSLGIGILPCRPSSEALAGPQDCRLKPRSIPNPRREIRIRDPRTAAKVPQSDRTLKIQNHGRRPRHLGFGPWGFQHQASNGGLNGPELSEYCL